MPSTSLSRTSKRKNLAAVKLGRLGGKARARKATTRFGQRVLSGIGRKGAAARWKKAKKR
jgi:hypothetical protein